MRRYFYVPVVIFNIACKKAVDETSLRPPPAASELLEKLAGVNFQVMSDGIRNTLSCRAQELCPAGLKTRSLAENGIMYTIMSGGTRNTLSC